jgi:hypothetical protein
MEVVGYIARIWARATAVRMLVAGAGRRRPLCRRRAADLSLVTDHSFQTVKSIEYRKSASIVPSLREIMSRCVVQDLDSPYLVASLLKSPYVQKAPTAEQKLQMGLAPSHFVLRERQTSHAIAARFRGYIRDDLEVWAAIVCNLLRTQ